MQVRDIIRCPICLEDLKKPVSISCGHTMCIPCLKQVVENQQFPSCPLCRKITFASVGAQWQCDDILVDIIDILKKSGEDDLLQEFPKMVICFDCALTPINPIILPCQHLFCMKCIEVSLGEDLICPVCQEWATFIPNTIPINVKYQELIEWFVEKTKTGMEEEQSQIQTHQTSQNNHSVNGMPVFFYDEMVHFKQKSELIIVERRYIQMLKIVSNGSGNFPIITQMKQEQGQQMFGDLVKILKIKQSNQQIYVQTQGSHRIIVTDVYTLNQFGEKIIFTDQMYRNEPEQLWMCNFQTLCDSFQKDYDETTCNWFKIINMLKIGFNDLSPQLQEVCRSSFSLICSEVKQKKSLEANKLIEDASLILIKMLRISNSDYQRLYYSGDVSNRLKFIWQHFQKIQTQHNQLFGSDKIRNTEYIDSNNSKDQKIKISSIDIEQDEEDDENDLKMMQFKDLTISQQIFMNLFKLENIIQNQD